MAPPSVLRQEPFRLLWLGEIWARLGHQVTVFLLPILVATVLHGSATQVGLASAAQTLPAIALTLVAGAWAGRLPVRWLLAGVNVVRGLALATVGALYAAGGLTLWVLLAAAVVIGSASVFYDVGYQVTIPRFVPAESLVSANGLIQSTTSVAQMAGPALAGFLVQTLAPDLAVWATTLAFTLAVVPFCLLRARGGEVRRHPAATREGIRFIWTCRHIRDLCLQSALFNLHEQAFLTVFLLYGLHALGMSAGSIGAVIGLGSFGALAGSLLAGPISRRAHLGATMTAAIAMAALSFLMIPILGAVHAPVALLGLPFAANGIALAVYNVFAISLRQHIPPTELLGPVTGVYRLAVFGTMPLGSLAGGLLADRVGVVTAMWIITASMSLSSSVLLWSPLRRARSTQTAREAALVTWT